MTIEEVIKYCDEQVEGNMDCAHLREEPGPDVIKYLTQEEVEKYKKVNEETIQECLEFAIRYKRIAKWLRELVHLRNITEYLRDMVTCFEFMDSMHYNEDIIEWAESELRVDMRENEGSESE